MQAYLGACAGVGRPRGGSTGLLQPGQHVYAPEGLRNRYRVPSPPSADCAALERQGWRGQGLLVARKCARFHQQSREGTSLRTETSRNKQRGEKSGCFDLCMAQLACFS